MDSGEAPKAVPELTQAARDAFRDRFLLACYRKFGTGIAPEAMGGLVAVGRALAEEQGIDPSAGDEAYVHWSRRGYISRTQAGGGHLTTKGQDAAEELLRRIEASGGVAADQPAAANAALREPAQHAALGMIDSALASLEAIAAGPEHDGPDRIVRWWERIAQLLQQTVSASEAQRFSQAYSDVVPGLILGGTDALSGAAERGRSYLRGLRADIEKSPELFTPQSPPAAQAAHLHPLIEQAARALLRDGHHAQAVFEASKALVTAVKARAKRTDLDGAPLMRTVFSPKAPLLAFNRLADQSDRDEQEGMMHLYEGALLAVRNPRAHAPVTDTPAAAQRYLELLNFLAYRLDEATKRG